MQEQQVRCIVTGDDQAGHSEVVSDEFARNIVHPIPGDQECALINLWRTHSMPTKISAYADLDGEATPLEPSKNGINFRYVTFPPDAKILPLLKNIGKVNEAWSTLHTDQSKENKTPHPLMHRTKTVDFGIVLEGEIYLILDKEERLMKAGDVAIQRGTNHAWSNRSNKLARMAFILIDAE